MKIKDFFKLLIPAYIEIRSLYWIEKSIVMNNELSEIFHKIDQSDFSVARLLIEEFEKKYEGMKCPNWVGEIHSQIHRANSMLVFLG